MRELTKKEVVDAVDAYYENGASEVDRLATLPGTTHLALYVCEMLDSSKVGMPTPRPVGPGRSIKTVDELKPIVSVDGTASGTSTLKGVWTVERSHGA